MMSASLLRKMMKDLFGPVEYVVIDTDKNRYPIGSGRVRFSENEGYRKAIEAEFVEVKVSNFTLELVILYSKKRNVESNFRRQNSQRRSK